MIHAEQRMRQRKMELMGVTIDGMELYLVDRETERELTEEETIDLFLKNEITGVFVKLRPEFRALAHDGYPVMSPIIAITEDSIILEGEVGISKEVFHRWYEGD